jgi:hypothetical protein
VKSFVEVIESTSWRGEPVGSHPPLLSDVMSRPLSTQVIAGAIKIIGDKNNWCQFFATRDRRGRVICLGSTYGNKFCAFAALNESARLLGLTHEHRRAITTSAERQIIGANDWSSDMRLSAFNDSHSHQEVLLALERAL